MNLDLNYYFNHYEDNEIFKELTNGVTPTQDNPARA